jgi:uncharacterized delta-60 repeat protein
MATPASSSGGDFGAASGNRTGGGRYLLKRLVGRGDFSEVWLARDVKNARDLALKFLPRAFLQDKNLLELFQQEVNRNKLLKHPHIIPASELVLDYDTAAIAMEFVDGWSLASMKVDKLTHCYSVAEIESQVRELCEALAYAHSEFGMVHGDLKPSNLLVSAREGIKVTDFGFAALLRNEASKRRIANSGSGGMGFLSPQQVMGDPPTKLDDIYSLGATIYDLLTGTPPFYKGEVIAQICSLKPVGMTQRLAELGVQGDPVRPIWEATVAACLAKNPADRPQSVDEVWQMLNGKPLLRISHDEDEQEGTPPVLEPAVAHEASPPPIPVALVNVPPQLEAATVRPSNLKWIAAAFAGVVIMIIGIVVASKVFNLANIVSGDGKIYSSASTVSVDKSFNLGTGADRDIRCMALQSDGKILIGGMWAYFNGIDCPKLARLNPDGTLDMAFTTGLSGHVYAVAVEPDGKIVIGGIGLWPKEPRRKLSRLEPGGSRDAQFHGGGVFNQSVRTITLQPDGKILVGGDFSKFDGKEHHGLFRMSSDGTLDDSFNISSDGSSTVVSTAIQPDGKILEAGVFNNYDNLSITHLIRLNSDGSFDSGFNAAAYAEATIRTVLLQKDGKILACGFITNADTIPVSYITRINPDGSPDADFRAAAIPGDAFWSMAVQTDGKIVVGGYNDNTNNQISPFLGRLNADGSVDNGFELSNATGGCIWSVAIQPDGKILAAGVITSIDGTQCGNIVRLQD